MVSDEEIKIYQENFDALKKELIILINLQGNSLRNIRVKT